MIYKVKAKFIGHKTSEFLERLKDKELRNQKPDGLEIISSMKRAKITAPGVIEWYEMCFCSSPLKHERATVYDHYLTEISTERVDDYGQIEGDSFWEFLNTRTSS